MLTLILLLFMLPAPEGGTVVLNTGIPGAEFYLDGTFVAATDENGTLTMENLPGGSFAYSVVKRGYKKYKGTFSIREGETKRLSPLMERIRETSEPDRKPSGNAREIRPPATKPLKSPGSEIRSDEARPSPAQSPAVAAPTDVQPMPDEAPASSLPFILIGVAVAASAGLFLWLRNRKRTREQIPPLEAAAEFETPSEPAGIPNRPDPQFIEELRRREELLNAGFVGNNPRVVDRESMKEKEVVIVLPKEAFRYEEDK